MVYKPVLNCHNIHEIFKLFQIFVNETLSIFIFGSKYYNQLCTSFSLHNCGILFGMYYTKMFISEKQGRFTCVGFSYL